MAVSYVTLREMATLHHVAESTLYAVLRTDLDREPALRRLPGAYRQGAGRHRVWMIPRPIAEAWRRSPRGRKVGGKGWQTTDTCKRDRVLDFIRRSIADHGYAPTITEIALGAEVSLGGTHKYLKQLEALGLLTRKRSARTIVLFEKS